MSEIEGFKIRLAELRKANGKSQEELGADLGLTKSAISSFETGKSLPSLDNMVKLSRLFSVTVDYLLTGVVELGLTGTKALVQNDQNFSSYMQPSATADAVEQPQRVKPTDNLRILTVQIADDKDENIEMVGVQAAAGYASGGFRQKRFVGALPSFRLPGAAYRNGTFRCFEISGDSMQSTFQNGDWVICRFVEDWARDIRDDQVYVVVTEETVLIKRALNELYERQRLVLQSDNVAYPAQPLDGDNVREVWLGVARLTRQLVNPRYDLPTELARQRATLDEVIFRLQKLEAR